MSQTISQEVVTKSEIDELKKHVEEYNTKNYNAIQEFNTKNYNAIQDAYKYIDVVNGKVDSMEKFQKYVIALLAIILTVMTITMFALHSRNKMPRTVVADIGVKCGEVLEETRCS